MLKSYDKRDILLALCFNPIEAKKKYKFSVSSRLKLVKMAFLVSKMGIFKSALSEYYNFQPNLFGPFCYEIYDDLRLLENGDYIECANSDDLVPEAAEEYAMFAENFEDISEVYTYQEPMIILKKEGIAAHNRIFTMLSWEQRLALNELATLVSYRNTYYFLNYIFNKYPEYTKLVPCKVPSITKDSVEAHILNIEENKHTFGYKVFCSCGNCVAGQRYVENARAAVSIWNKANL